MADQTKKMGRQNPDLPLVKGEIDTDSSPERALTQQISLEEVARLAAEDQQRQGGQGGDSQEKESPSWYQPRLPASAGTPENFGDAPTPTPPAADSKRSVPLPDQPLATDEDLVEGIMPRRWSWKPALVAIVCLWLAAMVWLGRYLLIELYPTKPTVVFANSPVAADSRAQPRASEKAAPIFDEKSPCSRIEKHLSESEYTLAEGASLACLEIYPNNARTWYLLSRALAGQKRYQEALTWVDKAVDSYPGDKDLHVWRIWLIANSGDLERAWNERYKILKVAESSQEVAMLIGDIAYRRKDCVEAVKWYDYVAKKWPGNAERAIANRDHCLGDASVATATVSQPDAGPPSGEAGAVVLPWRRQDGGQPSAVAKGLDAGTAASAQPAEKPSAPDMMAKAQRQSVPRRTIVPKTPGVSEETPGLKRNFIRRKITPRVPGVYDE